MEQAQFKNPTSHGETQQSHSVAPAVVSEHGHHHHETIQLIVEKDTAVPVVTHTNVRLHKIHREASIIHGTTVDPAMTATEFEKANAGS